MRFGFWLDTSNSWQHMLAMSRVAEQAGWDGVWVPDHFMPPPEGYPDHENNNDPELGEVRESWSLAAALAASVPRVRIGHMVAGNTYRHPALIANMAAVVQEIAGGRFVMGLGAGWQENEHRYYGLHYGTTKSRIDRFEEACEIIQKLFTQERTDFAGEHYTIQNAPLMPKPDPVPPFMIGAQGEKRMLPIVAKWADEWNMWGLPPDLAPKMARLDQLCEENGRDPKSLARSAAVLLYWADTEEERKRLAEVVQPGRPILFGTPAEIQEQVGAFQAIGVDEIIIPDFNFAQEQTAEILEKFIQEVAAQV